MIRASTPFVAFLFTFLLLVACGATEAESNGEDCCPRDTTQSGSMRLGGSASTGCHVTHDFWCSTNWRIEKDEHSCEVWRYDLRAPTADETPQCQPKVPSVPRDAGGD
ncbi:MAG TPA: hypothetical protein VM925_23605 [Labilithrix sp.]|nr:hypothetical protein [Labilithrix sp.]